ncbi:uncharacterized protein UV8b_06565 [Ustilaginoidea virens]|uniref:Uncharacterized protein n=1 Tax=Ustilaginoidea virens TaxID=1159556 RepID=A0A8E5HVD5_USTVR|nr:uncharacterized protein UV8b_06565 [Ustilaginoidea virens]QUC22324.1 hypothetical protein UV8b_06565 [Ustilaginoidea virens]
MPAALVGRAPSRNHALKLSNGRQAPRSSPLPSLLCGGGEGGRDKRQSAPRSVGPLRETMSYNRLGTPYS